MFAFCGVFLLKIVAREVDFLLRNWELLAVEIVERGGFGFVKSEPQLVGVERLVFVTPRSVLTVDSVLSEFQDNYHDSGFWSQGSAVNHDYDGPLTYTNNGEEDVPNPNSFAFINLFFETQGGGWEEEGEQIDDYVNNQKDENKGKVLAVTQTENGEAHALIIEQVAGNEYYVYDPSSGERKYINKDDVLYATKVTGQKKPEENEE